MPNVIYQNSIVMKEAIAVTINKNCNKLKNFILNEAPFFKFDNKCSCSFLYVLKVFRSIAGTSIITSLCSQIAVFLERAASQRKYSFIKTRLCVLLIIQFTLYNSFDLTVMCGNVILKG